MLVCSALLAGCTIRLAPEYDADLLDGITAANQQTLVLFAKIDAGSTSADFAKYSDEYAQRIAAFEALEQRASTRPFPPLTGRITKLKFLADKCQPEADPKTCLDATDHALQAIVATLRKMREQHESRGLAKDLVGNFRDRYDNNIRTALTIETALKR